jgi:hypothetical protein
LAVKLPECKNGRRFGVYLVGGEGRRLLKRISVLVTVAGVVSGEFHEECFSFVVLVRVNLKQQKGSGDGGRNSFGNK